MGYTEMPSPGIEPGTSVSGAVRRNQVPRRKVRTHWGYISYIYPRTARATSSSSTSTIGEIVGPRLPRSTTYGCVHYRARHGDLTTELVTFVLRMHEDGMHARSFSSTAPQFQRRDKISVIAQASFYVVNLTENLRIDC
jgi:hypothetical protein